VRPVFENDPEKLESKWRKTAGFSSLAFKNVKKWRFVTQTVFDSVVFFMFIN
jgi:hypothetical protein